MDEYKELISYIIKDIESKIKEEVYVEYIEEDKGKEVTIITLGDISYSGNINGAVDYIRGVRDALKLKGF